MTGENCCCLGELSLTGFVKWIWKWCTLNQASRKTELGYLNCISELVRESTECLCTLWSWWALFTGFVADMLPGIHIFSQVTSVLPAVLQSQLCHTSFSVSLVPRMQSWSEEGRGNLLEWWRIVFILLKVCSVLETVMQKSISENRS